MEAEPEVVEETARVVKAGKADWVGCPEDSEGWEGVALEAKTAARS
jgi:hypothetical protein